MYNLQQRLVESERARERAQLTLQALQQGAASVMEEAQVSRFRWALVRPRRFWSAHVARRALQQGATSVIEEAQVSGFSRP